MGRYLICSREPDCPPDHPLPAALRSRAVADGMTVSNLSAATWLAVAGPGRPQVLGIGAWRLIGDVFNRDRPAVGRMRDEDPHDYERKLIARFWGRYIGVRLDAKGRLASLLRDPSGALDCIWWTQGPLTLAASDVPDWLAAAAGRGWRIDAGRVEGALHDPYSTSGELLLDGPVALLPGTLQHMGEEDPVALWRPDWIARSAPPVSDEAAAVSLRKAVDETLAGVLRGGGVLAAEISGGLDSSIIAAGLAAAGPDQVRLWLNAWGPDATADERPWVRILADHLGINATSVPRAVGRLTEDMLSQMTSGVRPGLAALDALHDADWARRFGEAGIDTVVTGKGGDTVFIQPADIGVFVDLYRARGCRALLSPALPNLARWNERSVWTLARQALGRRWTPQGADNPHPLIAPRRHAGVPRHPWLRDIEDLGPAKRRQILGLVQGCGLHGPSLQTRVISVIHPLLAQPVVEACLALPAGQLTLGRRDRALARQAFGDRLPGAIIARRSKGEMTAFYGHLIADGLDVLRPWLLGGRLAAMGLIDPDKADAALTRESLAWRGGYVDIITTAAIEGWVRAWERRLPGA